MPTKRAKKKSAKKRTAPRKKTSPKSSRHWLSKICLRLAVVCLLLGGLYYFGSFETRASMERVAMATLNPVRTHPNTPSPFSNLLNQAYDLIPSSEGLVVEGGELGRNEDSHLIAGMPHGRFAIRPLRQPSYINLFNERSQQAACIALRLNGSANQKAKSDDKILPDARIPRLDTRSMTLGQWTPHPIAPAKALIRQEGERGASDAQLATNYAPMPDDFANGPWQRALSELTDRYPKRFDEVWIYLGPAYRSESSKLASGIAIPDAFYAIAFDLTQEGGLRALALLIPTEARSENLNDYITSIAQIEKLTGLQFLPELDFSLRDTLGNYRSPSIW